jgi:hypothetical protein
MLSGVFLFEVRAHSGKLTFLTAAGFFGFLGFVTAASGFGPDDVDLNGPWAVANAMGLLSLGTVFSLTLFCAQSVLRDDEHQMTEIICSTAVTRRDLLLGRFLGSFAAAVLAFAAAPFGMALGSLVAGDAERVVPFALVNYAWPFLVLALPSMFFVGALLFAVAALTRSSLATYVAGVASYVLYFAGALAADSPLMAGTSPTADGLERAALLDPFGISAFFAQTQFLTPAERNVRLIAMEGWFLGNRLLVLASGGAGACRRLPLLPLRPAADIPPPATDRAFGSGGAASCRIPARLGPHRRRCLVARACRAHRAPSPDVPHRLAVPCAACAVLRQLEHRDVAALPHGRVRHRTHADDEPRARPAPGHAASFRHPPDRVLERRARVA